MKFFFFVILKFFYWVKDRISEIEEKKYVIGENLIEVEVFSVDL